MKKEEETVESVRQRQWKRFKVYQRQREEEKNEKREKKKIGLKNINHFLITTVVSITVRNKDNGR